MDNNDEVKPIKYFTYVNMNKPVFYFGFTSLQFSISVIVIVVVVIIAVMILGLLMGLLIGFILSSPVYILMGKIKIQNAKGNPDYVKSFQLFLKTPKRVVDERGFLNVIYKNGKGLD